MNEKQKLQMERIVAEVRANKVLVIGAKDFEAYRGVIRLGILKAKEAKRVWKAPKLIVKADADLELIRKMANRGASRIIAFAPKDKKREIIQAIVKNPARCWVQIMEVK